MIYTRKLATTFVATFAVFFLAHQLFPGNLVFGNIAIPYFQALLTASFGVALAASLVKPILHDDFGITLTDQKWSSIYLVVNMGFIYLMARTPLSNSVGIGVSGFWVSLILGVVVTLVQYVVFKDALHPKKTTR